ncbi:MAG: integration host factor subunit alpha [Gemmatimonadetes bacterium]|nr:integration host factor subunit alpha [Gemmatimonadota bacterium]
MSGRTLTRTDLYRAVQERIGLSHVDSAGLVEDVIEEIVEALVRGEDVKISGFAVFALRDRPARTGRNPKTGETAPITPRRVAVLRSSNKLKARINGAKRQLRLMDSDRIAAD